MHSRFGDFLFFLFFLSWRGKMSAIVVTKLWSMNFYTIIEANTSSMCLHTPFSTINNN